MDIEKSSEELENASCAVRLGKCEVCGFHDAKYTCPKCEVKTCSLKCNKIHKLEIECDGRRDRTKFVPINKFTNLDLSSDYRLMEEISRSMEAVKKNFGSKDDSHIIPPHLFRLRNVASQRKTTLKFLPFKFARHRTNTTQLHFKTNIIYWHIEWIFVNADNLKLSDSRVPETDKLGSVLNKYLQKQDDAVLQEKFQYYQAAGISGLKLFLKAEQKPGRKFYELDYTDTIKECLAKKLIIEYPTIHVLLRDHGCAYDVIDSDDEGESHNKDGLKTGNDVVEKILNKAETDENLYKSLKNLLFISEYSDEELSE